VQVTAFFSILIFRPDRYFAVKYRRAPRCRRGCPRPAPGAFVDDHPLIIVLFIFFWGTRIFF